MTKRIVAISDVHCKWNKLVIPDCDLLISCGDYSFKGENHIVKDFHKWLNKQPAKEIISVQGNHELAVEKDFNQAKLIAKEVCPRVHFIDEGLVEIDGIKIWCSAITPWFHNWAWNRYPGEDIQRHWDLIPNDVNILITHGPPYGILDELVFPDGTPKGVHVGCWQLKNKIKELKNLKLHFFGHIHNQGHGYKHEDGVSYYNAAICDELYMPTNPISIVDYERL